MGPQSPNARQHPGKAVALLDVPRRPASGGNAVALLDQFTRRARPAQYGSRSLNFCSLPVAVRTSASRTSMEVGHL